MQIIPHQDIDCERWDALVAKGERGPYDYSWYLDCLTETWYIYVNENYTKGFAFVTTKKLGIENITIAPFVREHRFYGTWTPAEINTAFEKLALHFYGGIHQSDSFLNGKTRTYQVVRNLALENHAKRNIQKAINNAITVTESEDIQTAFDILAEELGKKLNDFTKESQRTLKHLFEVMQKNNKLIIKEIRHQNEVVGGLFFFKGKERDVYIKGSANEIGKKYGGMYLAMKQQIEETLANGKLFDFDGSEVDGVRRFNHYFGAEDVPYYQISWDKNPFWYRLIRKIYLKLK